MIGRKFGSLHCAVGSMLAISVSFASAATPSPALLPCDGLKDTFLGQNNWIFENWEMQEEVKFTSANAYTELQNALEKRGVYLIALPVPSRPYAYLDTVNRSSYPSLKFSKSIYKDSWEKMIGVAKDNGLNVVDLLPVIDNYQVSTRGENFFYTGDHHWTTSGAQASAKVVADYIFDLARKKNISLSKDEKTILETKGPGYSGSIAWHYITTCKKSLTDLNTYKEVVSSKNEGLFDSDIVDIGVFGDSFGFTKPDNNFAPYLEYYTGSKVVNYSTEGSGFFGAMLGYLADPKINANLPKFIVIPVQGALPNDDFAYKSTIATLNLCKDELANSDRKIASDGKLAWSKLSYTGVELSKAGVLSLKFSEPVNKFNLKLSLTDGSEKEIKMDRYFPEEFRGSRTDYYIPLDNASKLLSISLQIDKKQDSRISTTSALCKS